MIDTPSIVPAPAQACAVIRFTIPREQCQAVMGPAIQEILQALAAQDLRPTGPMFSHHLAMPTEIFDFAVGFPVAGPVRPSGRVQAHELPAATVARTVYHGEYEGLGQAWGELHRWMAEHGRAPAAGLWESYVTGPEASPHPQDWRTELNRPLA